MSTNTHETTAAIGGRRLRFAWYVLLVALLAIGGYGGYLRLAEGLRATNLSSTVPWGAWVAFYIYFVGLSAGAFLVSTLSNVFEVDGMHEIEREALFVAIVSMIVALTFVLVDLGRMDRLWHPFAWRQPLSVLSWEVHAYALYIIVLSGELYFSMRRDLVARSEADDGLRGRIAGLLTLGRTETSEESLETDRTWLKRLGMVGIPLAIVFVHGGTGNLFAVAAARSYWFSALFPVIFITSAVVSGMALIALLYVLRARLGSRALDTDLLERMAALFVGFVVLDASLKVLEAFVGIYSLHPGHVESWLTIMTGEMWWSFWVVMVGLGWIAPLVLLHRRDWRRRPALVAAAGASVVLGVIGTRFNIVVPAQIEPALYGLPTGYYVPSTPEWLLSLGIVALGVLIYTIGTELLPLVPRGEIHD
ncbi:prokaryotic molybdopterin-containing oxidoreductase family, membrane subunit [Halobiforma haloterrestris]|uniref:Prokaryotic molybdopterin-containing oxidoreductase family, membrane subunit n=1 Tax=Natronobacterium haloterrestre TaxID=148448 RepID=A0A1I1LAL4_NATHA|nr:NrfD/PsrC family molybdoenzyme membrane anchor subunit [Halobiforma haloterrestris]SFC69562.1 prokaryotic molybdopterin-containing oxidoreductase family, membrane subunit [Halobiforma haloterrestris]